MDKNIVFSEYYYYVSLVFVVGLYISFVANLLQNCDKFNFVDLFAAMLAGLFTSIISIFSIIIVSKIKNAKYYIDFSLAFDDKNINRMLIYNFIMFILCGCCMIYVNSFCNNNLTVFCFMYIIFNSLIFFIPTFLIEKIHYDDKKFTNFGIIKIKTENIKL